MFIATLAGAAVAKERNVQFTSVDFDTATITLTNLGQEIVPLDGFRFCTADEEESLKYTGVNGFSGISLAPGESITVHVENDAEGESAINVADLGGSFAVPLDSGPWGLAIYFPPVLFGDGGTMADYVQWNIGGADDGKADERADEAVEGGLWTDDAEWVVTGEGDLGIELVDLAANELHGPGDYVSVGCAADFNGDGDADILDFVAFKAAFQAGDQNADCDESATLDILDFVCFQSLFNEGCD